ncbi:glycosyltransferase [Enterobacter hormaechei]|uniref:GDP-mannose-dependent alpha-(1-6)-phosphatidylinositol monomannoside mannosyltransferase n=4 Tax=Bacteria TaxID=2 RepID=A0A6B9XVQ8_ENTCL|nr:MULTISPECIES: glycosyltransferase [Enterobacter]QHR93085.1 GDP-mannose-dependent alpha-(1-6)-phosphatidylinositol monomannoside mannosyltransferase [Enterobacter cloacae]QLU92875.1 glycosyltransferase [Enterobacter roggenkampii]HCJ6304267.1 glycosyltransferase [Enterobacter hormaechei subsp. xiangfangensis]KJQ10703.1 glycosyl transferase family 1 [Enterobacter hormaechei]MBJ6478153.1 glycosyltransferase [Enterobacter hormaechei]
MKTVGIFRNQLFKGSEVFIQQQAEALQCFDKCYIGRRLIGTKPEGSVACVLNEHGNVYGKLAEIVNAITTSQLPYQSVLKSQPLDLIHAHFAIDGLYALKLAQKKGIPLVTTLHGFDVTVSNKDLLASRSPAWINYLLHQHKVKSQGDKFICVSDFIARQALQHGFPESKIIQHYIGIDVNKYQPRAKEDDQGIILHVARLVEKKGTAVLINAVKQVKLLNPDVKLVIIGEGPLLDGLKAQVTSLGLDQTVTFTGALPHVDVMAWMRKASMLVLPSITAKTGDAEGLGMVLLEAAVTGVPVIGTQHGGIPEAIIDEQTGFLVKERDDKQLAERISFLMKDEHKRFEMGKNARIFISEKFNLSKQTIKLEKIYQELIHG